MSAPHEAEGAAPHQSLSLFDAVTMIVGLIVGAGIFGTPAIVAGAVQSDALLVAVWVAGGMFSVIGALCYAELATAFPSAGGEYHFIQKAFGRSLAFLYGWARMTVIVAGSIAVFAYLFGDYLSRVVNLGAHSSALWAAFIVIALTLVNYVGIREGKVTQNVFTVLEVGGLVLIVVAGLILAPAPVAAPAAAAAERRQARGTWAPASARRCCSCCSPTAAGTTPPTSRRKCAIPSATCRARCCTRSGWSALLYVLVNLAYVNGLGYDAMARSDAVAADLLKARLGADRRKAHFDHDRDRRADLGQRLDDRRRALELRARPRLADVAALSRPLARRRSGSPRNAMLVQGVIALALVGFGAFQNAGFKGLVEYSLPVFWGFFMLVGISLFVLRAPPAGSAAAVSRAGISGGAADFRGELRLPALFKPDFSRPARAGRAWRCWRSAR